MHRDMDVLGRVGTSKRIGSSVLDELDSRAGKKLGELQTSQDTIPTPQPTLAQRFQDAHTLQFSKMESLDSHYATIPHTPKRRKELETESNDSDNNSNKKLKIPPSPPVNEITRRIRRLRIRSSLTGGSGNSNQSRTPMQAAVRNTTLTRQRPMDPPRFLRPTINSLNKHREARDVTKSRASANANISANSVATTAPPASATTTTATAASATTASATTASAATVAVPRAKPKSSLPRSQSVFQRLYTQTTISRSCSMGNVSVKEPSTSQSAATTNPMMPNGHRDLGGDSRRLPTNHGSAQHGSAQHGSAQHGSAQHGPPSSHGAARRGDSSTRFGMSRSKTSGSLSNHLDRPAWR